MLDWPRGHGRLPTPDLVLSDIRQIAVVLLLRSEGVVLRRRSAVVMCQRSTVVLLRLLCVVDDVVTDVLSNRDGIWGRSWSISAICVSQVNGYWGRRSGEKVACSVRGNCILVWRLMD